MGMKKIKTEIFDDDGIREKLEYITKRGNHQSMEIAARYAVHVLHLLWAKKDEGYDIVIENKDRKMHLCLVPVK